MNGNRRVEAIGWGVVLLLCLSFILAVLSGAIRHQPVFYSWLTLPFTVSTLLGSMALTRLIGLDPSTMQGNVVWFPCSIGIEVAYFWSPSDSFLTIVGKAFGALFLIAGALSFLLLMVLNSLELLRNRFGR